jgi:hypothetical protein
VPCNGKVSSTFFFFFTYFLSEKNSENDVIYLWRGIDTEQSLIEMQNATRRTNSASRLQTIHVPKLFEMIADFSSCSVSLPRFIVSLIRSSVYFPLLPDEGIGSVVTRLVFIRKEPGSHPGWPPAPLDDMFRGFPQSLHKADRI